MLFEIVWVPREQNAEADAITNGDLHWLNPDKRVSTGFKEFPFRILPKLLELGADSYRDMETVNTGVESTGGGKKALLKVSAPWD